MKILLPLLCCIPLLLPAQEDAQSSKELLRTALFEEEVNQDHKKAEAAYLKVTERYDQERYFAGLAFFRLAEIARKSGNQEKANNLYRRVAVEFSDQKEITKRALAQLGDNAPAPKQLANAAPISDAEALELRRLKKMERDSPDLLDGVGKNGWHPIHTAAANGWTQAVEFLLARKVKVDPGAIVKTGYRTQGYTPLHLAVIHGHLTIVDQLLKAKADPACLVYLSTQDLPLPVLTKVIPEKEGGDWSPLHLSILYQRRGITARLLEAKAPLALSGPTIESCETVKFYPGGQTSQQTWKFKATPLILAVWMNDLKAVETLITKGADLNQSASENGETPLLAAIWKDSSIVPKLIEQGAKVTDKSIFGRTALHWAIVRCRAQNIKRVLQEQPDVNIRVSLNQYAHEKSPSPLEAAIQAWGRYDEDRDELCNTLISAGAKPTARVLISASSKGYLKTIAACIKANVDPNGSNEDGDRPLHYAKSDQVARILVEAGANPNIKDHEGITPLVKLAWREDAPESRALVDYLLDQGADSSVIPTLLADANFSLGSNHMLPYIMGRSFLVGKSDPKAIKLALPRNWTVFTGEDLVVPGTPAPSLKELLSLNYNTLNQNRMSNSRGGSRAPSPSRSSKPEVVTDLIIYRPDGEGNLKEIAQLADQDKLQGPTSELQWGDIVIFRNGAKEGNQRHMPLIHYANGLPPRTVTFKVGPWDNKVSIEDNHRDFPGLDLLDHFRETRSPVDLSKITLRRRSGEEKTLDLTTNHDPKKIRLIDGDIIEYHLKKQTFFTEVDPLTQPRIHFLFPDRPEKGTSLLAKADVALAEILNSHTLLEGRDYSKLIIQRMGKEKLERIPVDILAASQDLSKGKEAIAKITKLLLTPLHPGDVLVFPPKENIRWPSRNTYTSPAQDAEVGATVRLVRPDPVVPNLRRPSVIPSSKTSTSTKPRVRHIPQRK